jgi:hypothetical protein
MKPKKKGVVRVTRPQIVAKPFGNIVSLLSVHYFYNIRITTFDLSKWYYSRKGGFQWHSKWG